MSYPRAVTNTRQGGCCRVEKPPYTPPVSPVHAGPSSALCKSDPRFYTDTKGVPPVKRRFLCDTIWSQNLVSAQAVERFGGIPSPLYLWILSDDFCPEPIFSFFAFKFERKRRGQQARWAKRIPRRWPVRRRGVFAALTNLPQPVHAPKYACFEYWLRIVVEPPTRLCHRVDVR